MSSPQPIERRAALRRPSNAEARLRQPGVIAGTFTGQVLDTSATGFRLRHDRLSLASGQVVEFELDGKRGQARAMWTRIVGNEAETGFLIL
jgi:hypothetical protein